MQSQLSETVKTPKTPRAQDHQDAPNSAPGPLKSFSSIQHLSCAAIALGAAVRELQKERPFARAAQLAEQGEERRMERVLGVPHSNVGLRPMVARWACC